VANQAIVQWLRQYLGQGYDLNALRSTLLQHGYKQNDIEAAIAVVYGKVSTPILSKKSIAITVAIIATIVLIALFFFLPKPSISSSVQLSSPTVGAGDLLDFSVTIQGKRTADVVISHTIEGINAQKQEIISPEDPNFYYASLKIPESTSPGEYILRTTILYQGKTVIQNSLFTVEIRTIPPSCSDRIQNQGETGIDCGGPCSQCASCTDGIQNQGESGIDCGGPCTSCSSECDDSNSCTSDAQVDGQCIFTPLSPCCGDGRCESGEVCAADCGASGTVWEKLDIIKETAKTDPAGASAGCVSFANNLHKDKCYDEIARVSIQSMYCEKILDDRTKEECFIAVAKDAVDKSICAKIVEETRRDRCYMYFATAGIDYSVCELVSDYYLKQLCFSMESMQEAP